MATISERHKQALKDVSTLNRVCGEVYDYCGAWCNNDVLSDLLKDPSKKNATIHLESLIFRYFDTGVDNEISSSNRTNDIDTKDPDVYRIGKRYGFI